MDGETLTAEAILSDLGTALLPRAVYTYGQVGSTMDIAREIMHTTSATVPFLVLTEEQTAGRGRMGRPWVAPPGSALLFSLVLRPTWLAPGDAPTLIWLACVALCEGIVEATGLRPQLKWPNDLLLALPSAPSAPPTWHKLSGILLEANSSSDAVVWAIIGCGLNVSASPPATLTPHYPATNLSAALGRPVARLPLLRAILKRMDYWYTCLQYGGRDQLFAAWRALLVTLGAEVRVSTAEGTLFGRAEDVDASGALHLRDASGRVHIISNGDVN